MLEFNDTQNKSCLLPSFVSNHSVGSDYNVLSKTDAEFRLFSPTVLLMDE